MTHCSSWTPAKAKVDIGLQVIAYHDPNVFEELRLDWNDLLSRAPIDCVFYTWEWHKTWWEAYQPGELLVLACSEDDNLLGIAPLFVTESPAGRTAQIIGCVDVTDYLDFIVDAARMQDVFAAFADYLSSIRDRLDALDLCNIPQESPTHGILPELLRQRGFETLVEQQEVCPVIELPDAWSDYLLMLDKKQRHELRRKLRRIHGIDSDIDWYIVNGCHDLDSEVDRFVDLMAASDPDKQEFLQDDGNLRFFKQIVPLAQERGWLQMNFLTVDDERIAGYFNFIYGNRVLVYNSGLNHHRYGELSPGIVLLAYNIQFAIENGYRHYDFLRGDESYKYRMGGRDTAVMNIRAS